VNIKSSKSRATKLASSTLLAVLLAATGCAHIPDDRKTVAQQDVAGAGLAADIKLAREGWPERQWWTRYGDPQLDTLIRSALAQSPTLEIAAARIGAAQATLSLQGAATGAAAVLNTGANRQRYSGNGLFPEPIGGNYFSETNVQLQARYDFDWWSKNRAQIAAALGEVNARRADYAQAEQILTAAIAQSYFTVQGDWARLANVRAMVTTQTAIVDEKAKRIARGLAVADEQSNAEAELSNLKKSAAQIDAQARGEREALRALLGADSRALTDLAARPAPELSNALPAHLGLELLARRADLQTARWRVQASLSRIEVARAAFYPDINLNASMGLDSLSLDKLLSYSSRTLFIGPTLTLPLFDSQRLDAEIGAARSARNELIGDYNQAVFNAVREVAQQAVSLQGLARQVREQSDALQATSAVLRAAQARLRQGLVDRGAVQNAELARQKQQDLQLQLQNQQILTEVALTKALGGGYFADPTSPLSPTPAAQ
jgi:multidrug efflux system outer membrane protein